MVGVMIINPVPFQYLCLCTCFLFNFMFIEQISYMYVGGRH